MKWTSLNELREKYLNFFESKEHLRLPSFSLVPKDDKSLLLINSGMAPMKKYFTGEVTPPKTRVTTCQKCIRTPDIERVGITARHGTFFEMLGNFSFGDYFKHEATKWAWEFCTDILALPVEKIFVSIYQNDDEAFDIWKNEVGVDPSRIVRLGKEDNFWEHGVGPCGPCSELYFDRGEEYGCGSPDCKVGCDCDRYVEFWNLVFTQFENDGQNNYSKLSRPNIDTGMGLERLACIMQGVDNLFLVDTVQNIMKHISKIAEINYGDDKKNDISLRVITDHIRSTTFMISDGVMPSNEGRGYVLRRLLRRAARHGRLLSINRPFLSEVCDTVIKENEKAYPILKEKQDFIKKIIDVEEKSFSKTIDQGLQILTSIIDASDSKIISGDDAFKLNDTYGFPLDLTKEIAMEKGLEVDQKRFDELMKQQKKRAREARKDVGADAWKNSSENLPDFTKTQFKGYSQLETNSKVIAIFKDGEQVDYAGEGEAIIVLDATPFYAEGGGQVGDAGIMSTASCEILVEDTTKNSSEVFFHKCVIKTGLVACGDSVVACVDKQRRFSIMRNHTAAHLLQAALRNVLGTHVEQAGQFVNDVQVRFDFTHFSPLSTDEVKNVENLINQKIFDCIDVTSKELALEEAKKLGAMALFGEKYGDVVRVVNVEDFSIEFCGGTHVDNTSKLGLFKIVSESSVASGVRRIEAVTGKGALNLLNEKCEDVKSCCEVLKINNENDLLKSVQQITLESKKKDKIIEQQNSKLADLQVNDLINNARTIQNIKFITSNLKGTDTSMMRMICDKIKKRTQNSIAVIVGENSEKTNLAVLVCKDLIDEGFNAGKIAKTIAQLTGGNGGGKPDFAMAGLKDTSNLSEVLEKSSEVILSTRRES